MNRPDGIERTAKKVQDYIGELEGRVAELEASLEQHYSDNPNNGSNVMINGGVRGEDRYLPDDSGIDFFMGEGRRRVDDVINIRHDRMDRDRSQLRVECVGRVLIVPNASNSFYIRIDHS